MDLSSLGGPSSGGFAFDCVIQEVDIATGELLFQWRSMDHIPVHETLYELLQPAGTKGQRACSDRPLLSLRDLTDWSSLRVQRSTRTTSTPSRATSRATS